MKKRIIALLCAGLLLAAAGCTAAPASEYHADHHIVFSDTGVTIDGSVVPSFDYTWHVDPAGNYDEVKNSPGEYHTGTMPLGVSIWVDHDLPYYPAMDPAAFSIEECNGHKEWATHYTDPAYSEYVFSTLPVFGEELPAEMMHTPEEAAKNACLHITQPGAYALTGSWQGQVLVDLGKGAKDDPKAVVTLILDNVDLTCTVAPAVVFDRVYECAGSGGPAGAQIYVAGGSENHLSGANIFRMLKADYKKDSISEQKKARKLDGALYSGVSMELNGPTENAGTLYVDSTFEGVCTEWDLTVNGGRTVIRSMDDGINCNAEEDSTVTVNGGELVISAGHGFEGDGLDSNGTAVVNGGRIITCGNPANDPGVDADYGLTISGGELAAFGENGDEPVCTGEQPYLFLRLPEQTRSRTVTVLDQKGGTVLTCELPDDRAYGGMLLSAPEMTAGESYTVRLDGQTVTAAASGNAVS